MTTEHAASSETAFDAWQARIQSELQAIVARDDIPEDQKGASVAAVTLRLYAAQRVMHCLDAALAIGRTKLPKGDSSDVIELAQFIYSVESDLLESDDEEEEEPQNRENREQRRSEMRRR